MLFEVIIFIGIERKIGIIWYLDYVSWYLKAQTQWSLKTSTFFFLVL